MADSSALLATSPGLTMDSLVASASLPLQTDVLTSSSSLVASQAFATALQASPSKTALFLQNSVTGKNQIRVTNGTNLPIVVDLPDSINSDWKIVSTNDYNQDAQTDLLWRNFKTGENMWWVLNGSDQPRRVDLLTVQNFDWEIVSTDDFNHDGKIDILWRNAKTGENAWWAMKGNDAQWGFDTVGLMSTPDLNWKILGTNDYNNDGQVDILWRNIKTGENAWWLMAGATFKQALMLPKVTDLNWSLVGNGDYNGDGQVDLLWQHKSGQTAWWIMNPNGDRNQIQEASWLPNETDLNWKVVGVNDRYTPFIAALKAPVTALTPNFQIQGASFSQTRSFGANAFDLYQFTVTQSGIFTASLTKLTADADVRLIQDNGNQQIDAGEIKAWQWERGTKDETIRSFLSAGTYLVQVLGYNGQAADYQLSTTFTLAASDSQKFSINLQYDSSLGGLNPVAQQAARAAADFWESVIPSRSAITNSNNLNITVSGRSLDFSTYAVAGPIFTSDRQTVAIASGVAYINTQRLDFFASNLAYLTLVLIHEFAHVLGFGTLWEPIKFDTGNGTSLTVGTTLINRTTATYNVLNSANTTTYASWAYGDLLRTYTATAVPIEPGIFAHWSETRFGTEAMTPYAEAIGVTTPISALTLSALRDLGWQVNYGAAQFYQLPTLAASTAPVTTASPGGTTTAKLQAPLTAKCGCRGCLAGLSMPLLGNTQWAALV